MHAATQQTLEQQSATELLRRRDELIAGHLHLVKATAINIQRSLGVHTELEDLIHAGTMGIFDAASKYQDDKHVPFPVYAKHRIRGQFWTAFGSWIGPLATPVSITNKWNP